LHSSMEGRVLYEKLGFEPTSEMRLRFDPQGESPLRSTPTPFRLMKPSYSKPWATSRKSANLRVAPPSISVQWKYKDWEHL
jgi:hypothetical protein